MAAPTPLFTADDLSTALNNRPVTAEQAAFTERVVWGWLSPILGDTRPDVLPPSLWAAAVELGAIAAVNLTGLAEHTLGPERVRFDITNRFAILDRVRAEHADDTGTPGTGSPVGVFPHALPWPDPMGRY